MKRFPMYKYLSDNDVQYLKKKHFPHLHFWRIGNDFGLKYEYIELRKLLNKDFKEAIEVEYNPKEDNKRVFLIRTAKGYSLTSIHGYSQHFELVETTKYNSFWIRKPKEWEKIVKEASIR
jgi:hypothetical protein